MKLNIVDGVLIGIHIIVWMWLSGEFDEDEDQTQIIRRVVKRNRGG